MPLKQQYLLNVIMVLLAWLTVPLLGVNSIKRFFPASILIVLLEGIHVQFGKKRKWWVFYNKPKSYLTGEFPFNIGPHLIGSMWILKWTYGKFPQFLLLNAVIDFIFTFFIPALLKKLKVVSLKRMNNWQFFIYIFFKAPILYGLQYIFEEFKNKALSI
ncbi:hypothetical protein [Bacillus sp. J33]|uniref:hypothetical protein n=1 Tax=Bacillus sp. J33 TaxID=935836 RepID=UPI00047B1C08|nr:hypothetical protein [Bacillus sp. J33]